MHNLTAAPVRTHPGHWVRAVPLLARPIAQTMPWVTLLTGCVAGIAYLAVLARLFHSPLGQGDIRVAFLPAVAALAFVPRALFRPLTQTTPVPAWVAPAGHLVLAAPILAVTGWAQLHIAADTIPAHSLYHPPAVYPLIAQFTAWCAVTVAAAAVTGRSRYAELGGAVAAPVSLAAIAVVWGAPAISRFLMAPPASPRGVTIAWYAIATVASALTCAALRDQWHRYARGFRRRPWRRPASPGAQSSHETFTTA